MSGQLWKSAHSAGLVPVVFVSLLSSQNSRQLGIVSFIQSCYSTSPARCTTNYSTSLVYIEDFEAGLVVFLVVKLIRSGTRQKL